MSTPHKTKGAPSALVTRQEAARHYGVTVRTLDRWIDAGRVPAYRVGDRMVRVRVDDLDGALERIPARRRQTQGERPGGP